MKRLRLNEYSTLRSAPLTSLEAAALRGFEPKITITPAHDGDGYDLTATSWVGTIQLASTAIEIRPKVPVNQLMFLLTYALDPGAWRQDDFMYATIASNLEAIVGGFNRQVRRAIGRGLLQGYRSEEDALQVVRGRIRFDDQLRNRYGRFPPVEVRYDEFTEDIEENRLLRTALERLARLRIRSPNARHDLTVLRTALQTVSIVDYDARRLPKVTYTPLSRHYRPAVELARLILRAISLREEPGHAESAAFLIDMNALFEDFVVISLREALGLNPHAFPQGGRSNDIHLDRAGRIRLEPDLSWWCHGRCVFVGDVKYKRLTATGFKHPDMYQILAYMTALDLPRGLLVYAAGEAEDAVHELIGSDKVVEVRTVNLSRTPDGVLADILGIAGRVRAIASRPAATAIGPRTIAVAQP